jgi:hypothetical protein
LFVVTLWLRWGGRIVLMICEIAGRQLTFPKSKFANEGMSTK